MSREAERRVEILDLFASFAPENENVLTLARRLCHDCGRACTASRCPDCAENARVRARRAYATKRLTEPDPGEQAWREQRAEFWRARGKFHNLRKCRPAAADGG